MIAPMLDHCIVCGRPAIQPGAGICRFCEIRALIALSLDRMRAALSGEIPVLGKRLQPSREGTQIKTEAN